MMGTAGVRQLSHRGVRGTAVLVALLIASVLHPAAALAKSFTVDKVDISARVASDGSVTVAERRTMTFDGDYSRVFWVIPTAGVEGIEILGVTDDVPNVYVHTSDSSGIEDRAARVPGTVFVRDVGDAVEVHVFHGAANSTRTFTLTYRVLGGAKRWADTGELYWQLVGDGWEVGIGRFRARIELPEEFSKKQVRVWAHGPLTGEVSKTASGTILMEADDVPARTFVEVRALFPESSLARAPQLEGSRVDEVLAEEKRWADDANKKRRAARLAEFLRTAAAWLIVLLSAGGVFMAVRAFLLHGREYRTEFQGDYFREDPRPDLPPSVVGAFLNGEKPENKDVAAMLMDLSDKGVLRMEPVVEENQVLFVKTRSQTYRLTYSRDKESVVAPFDRKLCDFFFFTIGDNGVVTLDEIEDYGKSHAKEFVEAMDDWKGGVSGEVARLGLYEAAGSEARIMTIVGAMFIGIGGVIGTIMLQRFVFTWVPVVAALVMGGFAIFMTRRSREGNELFAKYRALEKYLKHFSRLNEVPPSSVVLWNRYLVLAVVFGVADEVIEQLRMTMPQVVTDPAFQNTYWWVYAGPHGMSPVSALSTGVTTAASVATSKMSSASGGGGGFSGGGGGGFGGGGGGAD